MCVHNNIDYYGQCASDADLRCAESNLSRWNVDCITNFIFEWNHWNVVTSFEQPSNNDLYFYSNRWTMCHNNNFEHHG